MVTQLLSFLAVIEEGSLHRAATRLGMSQPALSRQMQALEHELGGRLLERTSTGVKPTRGGHALAAKMGPILGELRGKHRRGAPPPARGAASSSALVTWLLRVASFSARA